MNKLLGKVALITGATSGIGESIAELMAQEGADVIIVGRNVDRGKCVAEKVKKYADHSLFVECDVTREDAVVALKQEIEKKYGRLDILVNNAGVFLTAPLEDTTEEDWQKSFDINVKGYYLMTKHFVEMLTKSKGTILNNASVAGLSSFVDGKGAYMYSASKAAVIQFTKLCAKNYAKDIRINCICPGVVDTPIFTNRDFSRFDGKIPMGRVAMPEEIAKVALFLTSEDASYITGAVIPVDGGMSI